MRLKEIKKQIFLKKGRLRKQVLDKLNEPRTATELAKELNKHRSSISRVFLELEKKGFVKCINPKDDRFRHYIRNQNKRKKARSLRPSPISALALDNKTRNL